MITSSLWQQIKNPQNLLEKVPSRTQGVIEVMTCHHLALPYKPEELFKGMKILLKMCSFAPQVPRSFAVLVMIPALSSGMQEVVLLQSSWSSLSHYFIIFRTISFKYIT